MDRIASREEVPENGSLLFVVRHRESGEREEAILVGGERIRCWRNYCRHFTHVRLDKGGGVPTRNGELVCTNHGAMFEADSGRCTFGPCEGAYLDAIEVEVRDGTVYLTDEEYAFDGLGPAERDPADRSSRSNVEF